jgi:hypothetical protein
VSTLRSAPGWSPATTLYSCQPPKPTTLSPAAYFGIAALDHLADRAALHHLAQRLRLGVALGVVHAPAHVRVEAQEVVAHQHLAVLAAPACRRSPA